MGKSTISMAIFHCKLLVHQRVSLDFSLGNRYHRFLDTRIWNLEYLRLRYLRFTMDEIETKDLIPVPPVPPDCSPRAGAGLSQGEIPGATGQSAVARARRTG